jgi:tripartite-type tricarboxylate transporter receptor subunit TctC
MTLLSIGQAYPRGATRRNAAVAGVCRDAAFAARAPVYDSTHEMPRGARPRIVHEEECKMTIRSVRSAFAAACIVAVTSVHAQSPVARYPERPVRIVVGYSPGGLPDTVARVVAQRLGEKWGQQVIVENRPGANTVVAADVVVKSPPDGYTLMVTDSSTVAINPFIYQKLSYDPVRDLAPISLTARAPLFLAAHPSVPAGTVQEFVALAKAKPGGLSYGSSGIGSTHHLCMESMKASLGMDVVHVPYKGTGQSVPALIGGQVAVLYSAYPSLAGYVKQGQLKLLAVNSEKRSALAPDVPTVAETLIPGFDFAPTIGVLGPGGMSPELVAKISADVAEVVKAPATVEHFNKIGIEAVGGSAADYAALLRADTERYARAVKAAGLKPE